MSLSKGPHLQTAFNYRTIGLSAQSEAGIKQHPFHTVKARYTHRPQAYQDRRPATFYMTLADEASQQTQLYEPATIVIIFTVIQK